MLLNYTLLEVDNLQKPPTPPFQPTTTSLLNAMFDEMYVDNILSEENLFENNGQKIEWGENTVMKARFSNDLEAGNFGSGGSTVTSVRFKRRKAGDFEWTTFAEMPYDESISLNSFVIYDKLVENQVEYEYGIAPVDAHVGNTEGHITLIGTIKCIFDDCYIFNETDSNYYRLSYNFSQGNIDVVIPNTTVNMLSGRYPIILYNADTQYKKGSIQCFLFTNVDVAIDVRQEKALREQLMNFLCDKKPKVIKAEDGTFMLVNIVDTPQLIPHDRCLGLYQVSFKFVECGDIYDEQTLQSVGLLQGYTGDE